MLSHKVKMALFDEYQNRGPEWKALIKEAKKEIVDASK